jgi:hypothetical protein
MDTMTPIGARQSWSTIARRVESSQNGILGLRGIGQAAIDAATSTTRIPASLHVATTTDQSLRSSETANLPRFPDIFIAALPRSRRVVALLINLGMGRREIAYLLGLSDMAMRQRIAGVRKAFADFAGEAESDPHASFPANGLARRALKASLPKRGERRFAVRDPDGTPIYFSSQRSCFSRRRQQTR